MQIIKNIINPNETLRDILRFVRWSLGLAAVWWLAIHFPIVVPLLLYALFWDISRVGN